MPRTLSALLLVSLSLLLVPVAGCTESCDCASPIWLSVTVVDALDGGPISSAQVNGLPCSGTCALQAKADGGPASAGPVDLTVTAESQPRSLTVVIPAAAPDDLGCCGLGPPWVSQDVTVALQPL